MGYTGSFEEERSGINPRIIEIGIAIVIGLITLIIGVLVLSVIFSNRLEAQVVETAEPPPQPSFDIQTSREAYVPAVELIRQEDLGAQLASAVGAWVPNIDPLYLNAGRTGWTFHFYLPDSQQMATVIVDRGGNARLVERIPWETAPALVDDQTWNTDSGAIMSLFLESCQAALNEQPDLHVEARLSASATQGRLTWQISAVSPDGQLVCFVNVDATTGNKK